MLQIKRAAAAIGAYVGGVALQEAVEDDALFGELRGLLLEHEVLFFRGQPLTAAQLEAVAGRFGALLDHPAYPIAAGARHVHVLESTPEAPTKIEAWHSDMTFSATPPALTLVHGQIIPEYGGDTLWASATAAYEALSSSFKAMLAGLHAVHDFRHGFRESLAEPGGAQRLASVVAANPPVRHPVVRTHPETGRKALYVNPLFTLRIEGLTALESSRVLGLLHEHQTTAEFTARLCWAPGTLAIWDNRSTQHKPINDYFPQHRKLHRATVVGERPR